ncbi:MAG: DUF4412 domain-containing protein [Candidatus Korobacteraceae bacterium]|jgi:negative regulator of sigma E activity
MSLQRSLVVLLVVLLAASMAVAQMPSPFSADMVMTSAKLSQQSMTGKIYFDGSSRFRVDTSMMGMSAWNIADSKSQIVYSVMPQQQMYMETRLDQFRAQSKADFTPYDASNPCAAKPDYNCTKVGTENVNGRSCNKWEFTSKVGGVKRWVWIDQQSNIPVKTLTADGTTVEMRNIQEGAQPDSLFQVPPGFRKMDLGEMMKGMMGGGRPQK